MLLKFNKVSPSQFLQEELTNKPDIDKMYQEFLNLDSFEAKIYTEEEIKKGKFIGLNDVWVLFKSQTKTIKIKMNISFNYSKNEVELYIKKFLPFNKKMQNGIDITFQKDVPDIAEFTAWVKAMESAPNFVQQFNDTAEIIDAIKLYKEITSKMDLNSEQSFALSDFVKDIVYNIDHQTASDLKIETIKTKNRKYILDANKHRVPDKHLSNEKLCLWELKEPVKIVENLSKTLTDIVKDGGLLSLSTKFNDWGCEGTSLQLIDFLVQKVDQHHSKLILITKIDESIEQKLDEYFFIIYDRLRFKKRNTMLDVVKDIENNRINNNNLFQYLFNNGNFDNIGTIGNWKNDEVEKLSYMSQLHENQKIAFEMATDDFPITFIQGPPGTGKTHTITKICQYYDNLGMKVLVSSQTNVAVENILENLWSDKSFEGLSVKADYKSSKYSNDQIRLVMNKKLKDHFDMKSDFELDRLPLGFIVENANVVGSTTTSSALSTRTWEPFYREVDVLIVDEISKSSVPELIRYVSHVKKIIFVGDQKQLAPLEEIDERDKIWDEYSEEDKQIIKKYISVSIFDKLFEDMKKHGRAVMLNINQRSLPFITETYSFFYKEDNNDKGLISLRKNESSKIKWKSNFTPFAPFTFISMNGGSEKKIDGGSRFNLPEAKEVAVILKEIADKVENANELTVAVISFYGAQVREIINHTPINEFKHIFKDVKVNTVDAFQGDQADIVILSTVRETKTLSTGFIDDYRRVNVAISRARDLVIMLGNEFLLKDISMNMNGKIIHYYKNLFDYLLEQDRNNNGYAEALTFRKVG